MQGATNSATTVMHHARAAAAGNLLGLVLSPLLLQAVGWRSMFLLFGALGVPLLALWNRVVPSVAQAAQMQAQSPQPPPPGANPLPPNPGGESLHLHQYMRT